MPILQLLLVIFISQATSRFILTEQSFPEFINAPNGQFLMGNKFTLDNPDQFWMQKWFQGNEEVLSISYQFSAKSFLVIQSNIQWAFVDQQNPLRLLTISIEESDEYLDELFNSIPIGITKGLNNILHVLNSVEWTPPMFKEFSRMSLSPRFHEATQDLRKSQVKMLDMMMKNHYSSSKLNFPLQFSRLKDPHLIFKDYENFLGDFWYTMIRDFFVDQVGSSFMDIFFLLPQV